MTKHVRFFTLPLGRYLGSLLYLSTAQSTRYAIIAIRYAFLTSDYICTLVCDAFDVGLSAATLPSLCTSTAHTRVLASVNLRPE